MRTLAILLLIICGASPAAPAQDAGLARTLDSLRTAIGASGAGAAVIFADGRRWSGVSGEAWAGQPVTDTTLFELGSVTKTYTAALVLQLVGDRALRLDDTLGAYVTDVPGVQGATIRQLLNHTSGIPDVWQNPRLVPAIMRNPARAWTVGETLGYLDSAAARTPGWRYSSTGYLLLGRVIERVTGMPLAAALRARLLEPLRLEHTFFEAGEAVRGQKAHAFLDLNRDGTSEDLNALTPTTAFVSAAWAAGGMTATTADAAAWMRALLHGTALDSAGRAMLWTLVDRPDGNRHGLGLLVIGADSTMLAGHLGNSTGFSAAVFHAPASGITVALLTNAHGVHLRDPVLALLRAAERRRN